MSSEFSSPSISSFSAPLPRVPVTLTSGRAQVRTTMRPLTFSTCTSPVALSGRVWLMGVPASAGRAAKARAAAMAKDSVRDMGLLLERVQPVTARWVSASRVE
jgi:hypothetical protein